LEDELRQLPPLDPRLVVVGHAPRGGEGDERGDDEGQAQADHGGGL
jgi:hypothetical protein